MHYYLGVDQTQPSALLIVDPTDVQKVAAAMAQIIRDAYPQFLNALDVNLIRKVGLPGVHGPILTFLSRLIAHERDTGESVVRQDSEYFVQFMGTTYNYDPIDLGDYVTAYLTALDGGLVPDSISKPWLYKPTSIASDIGTAAGEAVKGMWPLILGGIAIYAAVTVLMPKLILQKT